MFLAVPVSGQDDGQKDRHVNCPVCNHKGHFACKRHKKERELFEKSGAIYDSVLAECKDCSGCFFKDCSKCDNQDVQARDDARRAKIKAWLDERRKTVDGLVDHKLLHVQSRWHRITWDLKGMKVGRRKLSQYEHLHLFVKRLHEHRELYKKILKVSDRELPDVIDLYAWRDGRDQSLAAPKFTGMGSSGVGVKLMGSQSVYSMHFQRSYIRSDADLHRHLVHNMTHLLTSQMTPANWIGRLKAGWVDAGLAHYFEFKLDEKCTTYCYQEVATNPNFKGGKWLVPIRRMVASGRKLPSFPAIAKLNTDQLKPKEHAISFSYVHFLLEGDWKSKVQEANGGQGRSMVVLIRALKAKKPIRQALKESYGLSPLNIEEVWKAWVLKTYPTR